MSVLRSRDREEEGDKLSFLEWALRGKVHERPPNEPLWLIPGHGQGVGKRAVPLSLLADDLRRSAKTKMLNDQ